MLFGRKEPRQSPAPAADVWIVDLRGTFNKQGTRYKFPNEEWSSANHVLDAATDRHISRIRLYHAGCRMSTEDLPEAAAIWNPQSFARTGDLFIVGGMYVVKPPLAGVLARFNLGEGGLEPLTMYEADLVTRAQGQYWLWRLETRKNTFLPTESITEGYRVRSTGAATRSGPGYTEGVEYWEIASFIEDGDVAVSDAALTGADVWVEEVVGTKLFMKDGLAEALRDAPLKKVYFEMKRCRVITR